MNPRLPRKSAPRSASLLKSALRQRPGEVGGDAVPMRLRLAEALAVRPRVDFTDPLMRHAAMQAKGIGLCAFLITLAAFQRGLRVTFHYKRAGFDPRFASAKVQGHRGELFSPSDGRRTHVFSRTMGDRTGAVANAIAEDKHLTKRALARAGVRTPEGIVVARGQRALIEKFVAQRPGRRCVVKPLAGSMGRDVNTDLPAERVLSACSTIKDSRIVVEEYIAGSEYRVLDGRP